ncbi:blue-light-activated protein [bacterium BMS3Bbin06]|nr:blue-light-activated protein [bacterium BMS3Abin08]GBE34612.1 blue-light-activated protein [bacterium BMS3Bbin06]HDO34673.1 PAS domain S-box protein [Nitrospirota bacterium]HDY70509.1 PAS domain S-box protein [Nitrospirota bacterium]
MKIPDRLCNRFLSGFFRGLSIRKKLMIIIMIACSVALLIVSTISSMNDWAYKKRETGKFLFVQARIIGSNSVGALMFDDKAAGEEILGSLTSNPYIIYAVLYRGNGEVFAMYLRDGIDPDRLPGKPVERGYFYRQRYLQVLEPVMNEGERIGDILLVSDLGGLYAELGWHISLNAVAIIVAFFVAFLLSVVLQRTVSEPLVGLSRIMIAVSKSREYSLRAEKVSNDEIGQLVDGFNEMLSEIQVRDKTLRKEIDERRRVETSLRESEKAYRTLAENLPAIVYRFIFEKGKKVCFFNEMLLPMTGYREDELEEGELCYIDGLILPEDREHVMKEIRKAIKRREPFEVEYRLRHKDGSERHFLERGRPVTGPDGKALYIDGVIFDITEMRVLEKEAIKSGQLASIGELAAGVAHEINNPINGIINYAQILLDETDSTSFQYDVSERILREGDRIAKIVKGLLFFARYRKGERVLARVDALVSEALQLYGAQLRKDGIFIKVYIDELLPEVVVNPQQIEQVFLNLLSNARYALNEKYPSNHKDKTIEISASEMQINDRLYLGVVFFDRGTGIPDDIKNRIPEPFVTTKPAGIGTGLGLSISHGIIKDHGGEILIDSELGVYTKITIILPVTK